MPVALGVYALGIGYFAMRRRNRLTCQPELNRLADKIPASGNDSLTRRILMRRAILAISSAGLVVFALAGLLALNLFADKPRDEPRPTSRDQGVAVAQASRSESAMKLPVARVVLFNSGVGYFQREGDVEGDARVDLSFPVQDINDLLKSLVVQDLGGGQVSAISLDSQAPVEKTLRSFAIDLSTNPSLGQILDQARGEKVEVVLQQSTTSQPGSLTGAIVGVEKQKQPVGKDSVVEVEQLNLWCAEGLRQVKLADLQRIRFLNPILDSELKQGPGSGDARPRHPEEGGLLQLHRPGQALRPRRLRGGEPHLEDQLSPGPQQGEQAVLAGLGRGREHDRRGLERRQHGARERPADLVQDGSLSAAVRATADGRTGVVRLAPAANLHRRLGDQFGHGNRDGTRKPESAAAEGKMGEQRSEAGCVVPTFQDLPGENGTAMPVLTLRINPSQGVTSVANAAQFGDYFQYEIDHPVTLARQKSSLLPILNQAIEGTRVSIYNERVHARFPLLGIKLKNTATVPLTQGPITVFDGSTYAGDGRIQDLQPKEERLMSYAIDLGTEVQAVPHPDNGQLVSVKIHKGVVYTTSKVKESKTYTVVNRSEQDRLVLIEHRFRPEFKLTSADKPAETASDVYRFQVNVPRGKTARQEVAEDARSTRPWPSRTSTTTASAFSSMRPSRAPR